eukprot:scaffold1964_cov252-Isochrysis_galbana.AAC.13
MASIVGVRSCSAATAAASAAAAARGPPDARAARSSFERVAAAFSRVVEPNKLASSGIATGPRLSGEAERERAHWAYSGRTDGGSKATRLAAPMSMSPAKGGGAVAETCASDATQLLPPAPASASASEDAGQPSDAGSRSLPAPPSATGPDGAGLLTAERRPTAGGNSARK